MTTRKCRKELGLCIDCSTPTNGTLRCRKCSDRRNLLQRLRRQLRVHNNLCIDCGEPTKNNGQRCFKCREKYNRNLKDRRDARKQTGRCPNCGEQSREGGTYCLSCVSKHLTWTQLKRQNWKQNNCCIGCGNPVIDTAFCKNCLDKQKLRRQVKYQNKCCRDCGQPTNGKLYCVSCAICNSLRSRLSKAVKEAGAKKFTHTFKLLGCSFEFFKKYLEENFKIGMTWENYGEWHIDHIRPVISFNLNKLDQQFECFNYTNLQPLWAFENMSKGAKY